jgi:hypothetical protein
MCGSILGSNVLCRRFRNLRKFSFDGGGVWEERWLAEQLLDELPVHCSSQTESSDSTAFVFVESSGSEVMMIICTFGGNLQKEHKPVRRGLDAYRQIMGQDSIILVWQHGLIHVSIRDSEINCSFAVFNGNMCD